MARLEGKVAIVTGAAKGLGEADARRFAEEGATVILTDVDSDNGERVAAEIGATASFVRHDVRVESEWEALMAGVISRHGKLDVLVNNAGVVAAGDIETTSEADYRLVMAVSADGTFFGCKHAVRTMKQSGGGSIINMASIASLVGEWYVAAYCAAKGAVEALTRAVAIHCERNDLDIRCNSIHPSGMDTPMVASIGPKLAAAGLAGGRGGPRNKTGEPLDIANAALFLASDESRFINGTQLVVDKGVTVMAGSLVT